MRIQLTLIASLILGLVSGCAQPEASLAPLTGRTANGRFMIEVTPSTWPVPLNEPFEMLVEVLDGDDGVTPVSAAFLDVDAWMPDHGHGMLRQTRTEVLAEGTHRVSGMLLHMGGVWELRVGVAWNESSGGAFRVLRDEVAFQVEL